MTATDEPKNGMGLTDHLEELRSRLMKCIWVFMLGFAFCYFVSNPWVFAILQKPLFDALPEDQRKLYFTGIFENFLTHLKVAGYSSLLIFSPYFLYQIWAFISPGLYHKEKKFIVPFIIFAVIFFSMGSSFAYFFILPLGFKYFISTASATEVPILTIEQYYSTCMKMLTLFGLAFELPLVIVFLGYMGLVDAEGLRRNRRTAIIAITVVSAVVAPPDAISMLLLMAPLILLYELATYVVAWLERKRNPNPAPPSNPLSGASD
jgi:sec-independent protein translocase protein TatC